MLYTPRVLLSRAQKAHVVLFLTVVLELDGKTEVEVAGLAYVVVRRVAVVLRLSLFGVGALLFLVNVWYKLEC